MIVNLWSTPRTGSVWYSIYLHSQHPNSTLITELFNRYHMNMYHTDISGITLNLRAYETDSYYVEYSLDNGNIVKNKVYAARNRTVDQEEQYRLDLLENIDTTRTFILHNHVEPMNAAIKATLLDIGENLYIHRRDRRAQLGSYVIAQHTKQFAKFDLSPESEDVIVDIPKGLLVNMMSRIKVWDNMKKKNLIAYEDIDFSQTSDEIKKWPLKQNLNYRKRLGADLLNFIDQLVTEYEREN